MKTVNTFKCFLLSMIMLLLTACGPSNNHHNSTTPIETDTSIDIGEENETNTTSSYIDTIPPIITLNGDKNITIIKGTTYNDAGATAIDNIDGSITVTVSGFVDSSKVGLYTLTYRAIDSSGNEATEIRVVQVIE